MSTSAPPPHVAAAAAVVDGWLRQNAAPARVSDEQFKKMSDAERLNYARGFDQKQFTNGRAA